MGTYRTLEEKFLADYSMLENENVKLRHKIEELQEKLLEQNCCGGNFILDTMVNKAGRIKVFEDACCCYYAPDTERGDKGLKQWALEYVDKKIPKSVSFEEFFNYFETEFETAWNNKYDEEVEQNE